jgi:hypothetical protein
MRSGTRPPHFNGHFDPPRSSGLKTVSFRRHSVMPSAILRTLLLISEEIHRENLREPARAFPHRRQARRHGLSNKAQPRGLLRGRGRAKWRYGQALRGISVAGP